MSSPRDALVTCHLNERDPTPIACSQSEVDVGAFHSDSLDWRVGSDVFTDSEGCRGCRSTDRFHAPLGVDPTGKKAEQRTAEILRQKSSSRRVICGTARCHIGCDIFRRGTPLSPSILGAGTCAQEICHFVGGHVPGGTKHDTLPCFAIVPRRAVL